MLIRYPFGEGNNTGWKLPALFDPTPTVYQKSKRWARRLGRVDSCHRHRARTKPDRNLKPWDDPSHTQTSQRSYEGGNPVFLRPKLCFCVRRTRAISSLGRLQSLSHDSGTTNYLWLSLAAESGLLLHAPRLRTHIIQPVPLEMGCCISE